MTKPLLTKLALTDNERAAIRKFQAKAGYVGVVDFANGPRGGRYRSVRTQPFSLPTTASVAVDRASRAYVQRPARCTVYRVDHLGRVLDVTETY